MGDYGQCDWCSQDNEGEVDGHAVCWRHRDIMNQRKELLKRMQKKREQLDILIESIEDSMKPPAR